MNYTTKDNADRALFKTTKFFSIAFYPHKKMVRLHPLMGKLDEKYTTIDSKITGCVIVGKRHASIVNLWINRGKTL